MFYLRDIFDHRLEFYLHTLYLHFFTFRAPIPFQFQTNATTIRHKTSILSEAQSFESLFASRYSIVSRSDDFRFRELETKHYLEPPESWTFEKDYFRSRQPFGFGKTTKPLLLRFGFLPKAEMPKQNKYSLKAETKSGPLDISLEYKEINLDRQIYLFGFWLRDWTKVQNLSGFFAFIRTSQ